jgi:hypothetical protein
MTTEQRQLGKADQLSYQSEQRLKAAFVAAAERQGRRRRFLTGELKAGELLNGLALWFSRLPTARQDALTDDVMGELIVESPRGSTSPRFLDPINVSPENPRRSAHDFRDFDPLHDGGEIHRVRVVGDRSRVRKFHDIPREHAGRVLADDDDIPDRDDCREGATVRAALLPGIGLPNDE